LLFENGYTLNEPARIKAAIESEDCMRLTEKQLLLRRQLVAVARLCSAAVMAFADLI